MEWLPTSVGGAITAFCGLVAAVVVGVTKVATAYEGWKRRKRAESVRPPIVTHAPTSALESRLGTLERVLAEQAAWDAAELRRELAQALKELSEARQDAYQAQQALAAERLRAARDRGELARLRRLAPPARH